MAMIRAVLTASGAYFKCDVSNGKWMAKMLPPLELTLPKTSEDCGQHDYEETVRDVGNRGVSRL
jgi:hypothetical protein